MDPKPAILHEVSENGKTPSQPYPCMVHVLWDSRTLIFGVLATLGPLLKVAGDGWSRTDSNSFTLRGVCLQCWAACQKTLIKTLPPCLAWYLLFSFGISNIMFSLIRGASAWGWRKENILVWTTLFYVLFSPCHGCLTYGNICIPVSHVITDEETKVQNKFGIIQQASGLEMRMERRHSNMLSSCMLPMQHYFSCFKRCFS